MKKLLVMISVILFMVACFGQNLCAFADEIQMTEFEYTNTNCTSTIEKYEYPERNNHITSVVLSGDSLPASVDHSTSLCFPMVRSQGSQGSCAFFSAAYYQFTFQKNQLNNTYARTSDGQEILENVASPAYPYNVSGYGDISSSAYPETVHNFMRTFGCVSLSDLAYIDTNTTARPTTQAMIEALKTRVSAYDFFDIDTETEQVIGIGSTLLTELKTRLNNGYLLNVGVNLDLCLQGTITRNGVQEQIIYSKLSKSSPNHTMTVVGYDDTIWFDINADGEAQDAEYGALKLVNSWGDDWGNDGFIWVAYDALNYESAVSNWDSPSNRSVFFCTDDEHMNIFKYIEVENYDVNYIFKLDFDVSWIQRGITLSRANDDGTGLEQISYSVSGKHLENGETVSLTMVFDYSTLCDPIDSFLSDYKWSFNVWKPQSCQINGAWMVDDDDNIISTFDVVLNDSSSYYTGEVELNLQYGDMNYDGIVDAEDVQLLYVAISGTGEISTLQKVLADYNRDGRVNMYDVRAMYAQVGGGLNAMQVTMMQAQCILLSEMI